MAVELAEQVSRVAPGAETDAAHAGLPQTNGNGNGSAGRTGASPDGEVNRPEQEALPAGNAGLLTGVTAGELEERWRAVYPIPIQLEVSIPIASFRVRELLALDPEQILMTSWASGRDLPLGTGDVQLCWVEFEVVEQAMAVRITGVL